MTIICLLLIDTAQTHTLPTWAKVVENAIPMGTKWKDLLLDVNADGEKVDLEPISLSKLSAIKKANLNNFTERHNAKFAWYSKCEILKCL